MSDTAVDPSIGIEVAELPADFTRQRDMFDPEKHENARVVMAGCGGIGSATAFALSKMGIPHIDLIDPDTVEHHNIPNQLYYKINEGDLKVDALRSVCTDFGYEGEIRTFATKLEEVNKRVLKGVLITGFDSMEARQEAWKLAKYNTNFDLLIDGRIGKEDIVIYAVNPGDPEDIEYYETTLYSDEEAEELSCTERAIIDVMFIVAGQITRLVRRHLVGDPVERVVIFNQNNLEVLTA